LIALAHQDGDHLGSDSLSWNAVGRVHVHCLVVLFLCCDIFPIRIALCTEGGVLLSTIAAFVLRWSLDLREVRPIILTTSSDKTSTGSKCTNSFVDSREVRQSKST